MNSRAFLFLKNLGFHHFFYSDLNLVTSVLFASLNDTSVAFSYIFNRIYGSRQLSVYSLLSGLQCCA